MTCAKLFVRQALNKQGKIKQVLNMINISCKPVDKKLTPMPKPNKIAARYGRLLASASA